jgi:hypothetical protein
MAENAYPVRVDRKILGGMYGIFYRHQKNIYNRETDKLKNSNVISSLPNLQPSEKFEVKNNVLAWSEQI